MMPNQTTRLGRRLGRTVSDYGMLGVLLLLVVLFSVLTYEEHYPEGGEAARDVVALIGSRVPSAPVLIVASATESDRVFAQGVADDLERLSGVTCEVVTGDPAALRLWLDERSRNEVPPGLIVTTHAYRPVVAAMQAEFPSLAGVETVTPPSFRWPTFLLADNIRNIASQIAVTAIIAVGMTMVIITAGIDLSVGSLVALSAVVTARLIGYLGAEGAGAWAMVVAAAAALALCGGIGAFSGLMITRFRIPPFIATLAIMQVAAGIAYIISEGKPIYQLPEAFVWLGRGADPILGIPYAVLLMGLLYVAAHVLMSHMTLGRYIYAVGGNPEAARLAGIRVAAVLLFVYTLSGMLAGLGGVVLASQLKSGAPTYGLMYELYVIAAVVVGGTSLSGGEGKMLGTLIGAFVIAVIQNGMNLTSVETYTQKVVLGLVILTAVLLDRLKQRRLRLAAP
jgi:ribose transport system permease protein